MCRCIMGCFHVGRIRGHEIRKMTMRGKNKAGEDGYAVTAWGRKRKRGR